MAQLSEKCINEPRIQKIWFRCSSNLQTLCQRLIVVAAVDDLTITAAKLVILGETKDNLNKNQASSSEAKGGLT